MKKNNMLRIASVLLVAVLLSTCAISGVFAKYQKTGEAVSDDATVAKWGVTVSSDISGLFASSYAAEDDKITMTITNSVNAADDVVAPGTEGEILDAITIKGTPDVAVEIVYTATVDVEDWTVGGEFYCPLTIAGVSGLDFTSETAFEDAVKAAIEGDPVYCAPNTDLNDVAKVAHVPVTWSWAFEDTTDGAKQTIVKDTALGDAAADGNAASVTITVNATVTQVN